MYNQSFSTKELYRLVTQEERRNSGLKEESFLAAIEAEIGQSLIDGTYSFKVRLVGDLKLNGRNRNNFDYLCQDLIQRKLYNNLKRIYSVKQTDRNIIVRQMKLLMSEEVGMWGLRLDVRHFYETIDRTQLQNKLENDSRLSYQSLILLNALFSDPVVASTSGLPKGLSVSAAMAEMYMKYFDLEMRRVDGVYYYARYVDDIIVFCSSFESQSRAWKAAEDSLLKLGLELNKDKSYKWSSRQAYNELTYLGYTFKKNGKQVEVTIADKKLSLMKTRLTKVFVRFSKDKNYDLLKLRIKFLTGNFTLYRADTLTPIKAGIYFNYSMATDTTALCTIDRYYQRLLHCQKGRLGGKIGLSRFQMKEMEKYSFSFGYDHRVNHHFTVEQIREITNCWR